MRLEPDTAPALADQTEQDARQTVLSACQDLNAGGLNAAGLLSMGYRWKRSGATGMLTTPASPAKPVDSWHLHAIEWHALLPDPAPAEPWPGQPTSSIKVAHEQWLGLNRGLFKEFRAIQVILLLSPPHASALACMPRVQSEGLPPFHPALAAFGSTGVQCAPYVATGSSDLDQHALEALVPLLATGDACLLANLGMLVMGESVHQAIYRAHRLEGLARIYSLALQMGEPTALSAAKINLSADAWQHPV